MCDRVVLETPSVRRLDEFLESVARSRQLHRRWVRPPGTAEEFRRYLRRLRRESNVGYWICTDDSNLAGVVNINEIVRGCFRSAYLGYYAFVPFHGRGYMTCGMRAVLARAFRRHKLHRLEANIQPDNESSRHLIQRLGFRLEGFSPKYLKVAGRWCDHERWAMTVEDWRLLDGRSRHPR